MLSRSMPFADTDVPRILARTVRCNVKWPRQKFGHCSGGGGPRFPGPSEAKIELFSSIFSYFRLFRWCFPLDSYRASPHLEALKGHERSASC